MIKFFHPRVGCGCEIDSVITHIVDNSPGYYDDKFSQAGSRARLDMLIKIVGRLAVLLPDDQQMELVRECSDVWGVAK